ncbi:MAG TPA: cupin domain-containing protein [Methylophilus sp.]|nr:cupin domain-containing protein [Methylophilus sp.]
MRRQWSFGKHWDTHDVFILQLSGRKHWKVYQPTFEQPLAHQKSTNHKAECPEIPVLDNVLEAGDLLYIPRGWWHEALPIDAVQTFHIAVSTYPPRVIDYLIWLCAKQLPDYIEGRQSLNAYSDVQSSLDAVIKTVNQLAADRNNLQAFYQAHAEQQRIHSRFAIADLAKKYSVDAQETRQNKSPRLNNFLPIKHLQQHLVVNGFKLNLDEPHFNFISKLNERLYLNKNAEKEIYSPKQLSEFDVVEFVST